MARMHPADLKNYNSTRSEEYVFDALKEQLPDSYEVFYSVSWQYEMNNLPGKPVQHSETDFLIVDPSRGYICLEVKGGAKVVHEEGKWLLYYGNGTTRDLRQGPYWQAENSAYYYEKQYEKENAVKYQGIFGYAVCFPWFVFDGIGDKLTQDQTQVLTLDKRDMANLKNRINEIFHNFQKKRAHPVHLSGDEVKPLLDMIKNRRAKEAAAGALIEVKKRQFDEINWVQDSLLDFIENYDRAMISGGAGTGKTFIAMKKAQRLCAKKQQVFYVCKSRELAHMVAREMAAYGDFFTSLSFGERERIGDDTMFDAILVDEAQDFTHDEVDEITVHLSDPLRSPLYIFGDYDQDILQNGEEAAFDIEARPFILKYNIRNTKEIYNQAVAVTKLGRDTVPNTLQGVEPQKSICKNSRLLMRQLQECLDDLIEKNMVKPSAITIVSDEPLADSCLEDFSAYHLQPDVAVPLAEDSQEIAYRTIAEFKGLENDVVIYLRYHQEEEAEDLELWRRNNYVALTRARYYLYVIEARLKKRAGK